jgi:hypothetical protein
MLLSLLFSCTHSVITNSLDKLYFIEVSVVEEETEDVLAFSAIPIQRSVEINTLDGNGDPILFTGDLKINVRPGQLATGQDPWISVENGVIKEGDEVISFQAAFGPTRIWVSDEGDKNQESEREATFATGVSETLNFEFPTIAQFSKTTDDNGVQLIQNTTSHLAAEFTEVRVEGRDVIATVVSPAGFWVTDLTDFNAGEDGGFASLFVYTFSKPKGIVAGSRLTKLIGGNQEYLGTTQFSFPAYEVDPAGPDTSMIPAPRSLTAGQVCNTSNRDYDNHRMESFESALVQIDSATISFNGDQELITEYLEYGQWPVTFTDGNTSCEMFVDSSGLSYAFDPVAWDGQDVGPIYGVLNQIWSKWIIVLTDDAGLPATFADGATPRRPNGPRRPISRFPSE